MKSLKIFFVIVAIFFVGIAPAQERFFTMRDTTFESFSVLRGNDISFLQGTDSILKSGDKFLNSFAAFLKKNPHLLIQVTHYNFVPATDTLLCLERAAAICTYLEHKGVEHERLKAKGFGGRKHRENFDNYDSVKAFAERKKLSYITDFEVLMPDYKQLFNWDDSSFEIGTHRYLHFYCPIDGPGPACIDSLIRFLKAHPTIKIEIDCNDIDYVHKNCDPFSYRMNQDLLNEGIKPERFSFKNFSYTPYYTKEMEKAVNADVDNGRRNKWASEDELRQKIIILEK